MIEDALKNYSLTFKNEVLPILKSIPKTSYIGLAILILVARQTYNFLTPPKELRQFPNISIFETVKSFINKESVAAQRKRLTAPLINKGHKFYVSRVPLTWTVFTIDAVIAKQILLKNDNFPKSHVVFEALGENSPPVQFIGTDNVVVANGAVWRNQRRIMNPAFHRAMPVKTMWSVVPYLYAAIEDGDMNNVLITKVMKDFTLDVLGLAAFGFDFQSLKGDPEGWTQTYEKIVASIFDPWITIFAKIDFIYKYVSANRRRTIESTTKFNSMLGKMIDTKRQQLIDNGVDTNIPETEKDLLTLMLEADIQGEGRAHTTTELRHNVAVFFLAGHDTTANTLSFCLYHLAKNKHVQRKARADVLSILGDKPNDYIPTSEELKQMEYINMVIKENLRINAPFDKLITRITQEDIDLQGTIIPKGTEVSIDVSAIHMNPKLWANPDSFIPERFEKGGEQEGHVGLTWIPFSNGARQCIGMNFSLTEQRLVLAVLLKQYEIDISKDSKHYEEIEFDSPFNLSPESLNLKLTKRY